MAAKFPQEIPEGLKGQAYPRSVATIVDTLRERGERYGEFAEQAKISQDIQSVIRCGLNWEMLDADQREALVMIAHKIARILNGDPNYPDSWHDIAGYATLVEQRLMKEKQREN